MGLQAQGIVKTFGTFKALGGIDLDIKRGEFVALLGPSGSGKTTLLRILAGLDAQDEGHVLFNEEDMTGRKLRDRRVGFVFQHYALFKHMTVAENIGFGLRVRPTTERPNKAEIKARVDELLRLVQLERLGDRYPSQLSGGQRQRVALARALAIEPSVLLLDEPFGALDAKVRKELRRWLRRLHESMQLTSVFVTHDQEEALELADKVVIMNQGLIEQVGSPEEVYHKPQTSFVYEFLGGANRVPCEIRGGVVRIGSTIIAAPQVADLKDGPGTAYVRPEEISIGRADGGGVPAIVQHVFRASPLPRVEVQLVDTSLALDVTLPPDEAGAILAKGQRVTVNFAKFDVLPG
ncbi:sulfate/molybdate ABC transporter ATP-binding protein [Dongia rigui]|uniref:Sulfate/molybdate ABC transporter ATP-binding protein n=1 Tax=Dongia rigui TaxID=940149 RepID=A0ABU5DZ53_9PROT|nr:sulfate/molybdate ABC transporter ATP-binding protein [Dongia rigui]MDY0872612.1 sulfate/molybdate ABC transporter ATP-binding protein [Dongia rigui]